MTLTLQRLNPLADALGAYQKTAPLPVDSELFRPSSFLGTAKTSNRSGSGSGGGDIDGLALPSIEALVDVPSTIVLVSQDGYYSDEFKNDHAIDYPSLSSDPITTGDLILVYTATWTDQDSGSVDTPTDFTELFSVKDTHIYGTRLTCFWKYADGSESGNAVDLEPSGVGIPMAAVIQVFRGVDQTTAFDVANPTPVYGTDDPNPPAVSGLSEGAMVVAVAGAHVWNSEEVATPPDTFQAGVMNTENRRTGIVSAWRRIAAGGSVDPGPFGYENDDSTAMTIVLRPAIESPTASLIAALAVNGATALSAADYTCSLAAVDEVQILTSTLLAGSFTIDFDTFTTGAIDWDATAAEIETAIEAELGGGAVRCTGGPLDAGPVSVEFISGVYSGASNPLMVPSSGSVTATKAIDGAGAEAFDSYDEINVPRSGGSNEPQVWLFTLAGAAYTPGRTVLFEQQTVTAVKTHCAALAVVKDLDTSSPIEALSADVVGAGSTADLAPLTPETRGAVPLGILAKAAPASNSYGIPRSPTLPARTRSLLSAVGDSMTLDLFAAPPVSTFSSIYPWYSGTTTAVDLDVTDLQTAIDAASAGDILSCTGGTANDAVVVDIDKALFILGSGVASCEIGRVQTTDAIEGLWIWDVTVTRTTPVDGSSYSGIDSQGGALTRFWFNRVEITGHGINIGIDLDRRYDNQYGVVSNSEFHELHNYGAWFNCDDLWVTNVEIHDLYRTQDLAFFDVDAVNLAGSRQRYSHCWFHDIDSSQSVSTDNTGVLGGPPHTDCLQSYRVLKDDGVTPWITEDLVVEDCVFDMRNGGDQTFVFESNSSGGQYLVINPTIRRCLISGNSSAVVLFKGVLGGLMEDCTVWLPSDEPPTYRAVYFAAGGGGGAPDNPGITLRNNTVYAADGQELTDSSAPADLTETGTSNLDGDPPDQTPWDSPVLTAPTNEQAFGVLELPLNRPDFDLAPASWNGNELYAAGVAALKPSLTLPVALTLSDVLEPEGVSSYAEVASAAGDLYEVVEMDTSSLAEGTYVVSARARFAHEADAAHRLKATVCRIADDGTITLAEDPSTGALPLPLGSTVVADGERVDTLTDGTSIADVDRFGIVFRSDAAAPGLSTHKVFYTELVLETLTGGPVVSDVAGPASPGDPVTWTYSAAGGYSQTHYRVMLISGSGQHPDSAVAGNPWGAVTGELIYDTGQVADTTARSLTLADFPIGRGNCTVAVRAWSRLSGRLVPSEWQMANFNIDGAPPNAPSVNANAVYDEDTGTVSVGVYLNSGSSRAFLHRSVDGGTIFELCPGGISEFPETTSGTVYDDEPPLGVPVLYRVGADNGAMTESVWTNENGSALERTWTPTQWYLKVPGDRSANLALDIVAGSLRRRRPRPDQFVQGATSSMVVSAAEGASIWTMQIRAKTRADRDKFDALLARSEVFRLATILGDGYWVRPLGDVNEEMQRWQALPDETTPLRDAHYMTLVLAEVTRR